MVSSKEKNASKPVVLINPKAGGGAAHDCFRRCEHMLLDVLGDFEIVFSEHHGHAESLVRELLGHGVKHVIVAGGDGTVNEVCNGWLDESGQAISDSAVLSIMPGGTGGDFLKTLGILDPSMAVSAIAGARTKRVDIGRLRYTGQVGVEKEQRYFLNIASFGMSGVVGEHLRTFASAGGRVAYVAAAVRAMVGWQNPLVRIVAETESGDEFEAETPVVAIALANGRYFGGGVMIAPNAELDDGQLEMVLIGDMRRRDVLTMIPTFYVGTHVHHPNVIVKRVVRARAEADVPVRLEIDGETIGQLPMSVEILPQAINVTVP